MPSQLLSKARSVVLLFSFLALLALSACTNSKLGGVRGTSLQNGLNGAFTGASNLYTIVSTTDNTSNGSWLDVVFQYDASKESLSSLCTVGSKPCSCQFTWDEPTTSGAEVIPVHHVVTGAVTVAQVGSVSCVKPALYAAIPDTVSISLTVIPDSGNSSVFGVNAFSYTKKAMPAGSFSDSLGRSFLNVYRYSCYETYQRGMEIKSKTWSVQESNNTTTNVLLASQFCLSKAHESDSGSTECPTLSPPDYTAQSYYYNLYIGGDNLGAINNSNARYVCPRVNRPLRLTTPNWPMDSNFALASSASGDFPIGVEAFSKLSSRNDPVSSPSGCFGGTNNSPDDYSLIKSCLGFAAKVNPDGTCPLLTKSDGSALPTYRLRRYVALYPPLYDTDGKMIDGRAQSVDTIYVLDRPVQGPNGAIYSMRGPKPCPFSYYDHKGVLNPTTHIPSYGATNFRGWNGLNVDGIEFPNVDNSAQRSCSAILPVLNSTKTLWTMATVGAVNASSKFQHVYVRPQEAWAPHYEEDTDFQACTPQSSNFIDPPLHFARSGDNSTMAWCAESTPTQNPYNLDAGAGVVVPFTSHVSKNSTSAACTAETVSSAGPGNHGTAPTTCDRTVTLETPFPSWTRFPLLARENHVENALRNDDSYSCRITYDNNGTKSDRSGPTNGCCAVGTLLNFTNADGAHLEPGTACPAPAY